MPCCTRVSFALPASSEIICWTGRTSSPPTLHHRCLVPFGKAPGSSAASSRHLTAPRTLSCRLRRSHPLHGCSCVGPVSAGFTGRQRVADSAELFPGGTTLRVLCVSTRVAGCVMSRDKSVFLSGFALDLGAVVLQARSEQRGLTSEKGRDLSPWAASRKDCCASPCSKAV